MATNNSDNRNQHGNDSDAPTSPAGSARRRLSSSREVIPSESPVHNMIISTPIDSDPGTLTPSSSTSRTVNDYETRKAVAEALRTLSMRASMCSTHSCPLYDTELSDSDDDNNDGNVGMPEAAAADWVTENLKMETSIPQSISEEADRLMVLKSYLILDSKREPAFERLTGLAQRFFDVPIALVSLIDVGRQWFMSNRGLGDVRETPRKAAFCAHAIQSTEDLLIVPDTLRDARFKNNILVTGPPHIRFYAGAPLICPEGYKLGTLCIIDTKKRPKGLSFKEKQTLTELAALVMEAMVNRRKDKIDLAADRSKIMACMARDLMTPLEIARSFLTPMSVSKAQKDVKNVSNVQVALNSLSIIENICEDTIENFRSDLANISTKRRLPDILAMSSIDENDDGTPLRRQHSASSFSTNSIAAMGTLNIVAISDLVTSLRTAISQSCPTGYCAPIEITVDPSVPQEFLSDGLKLFRSALHFLVNASRYTPFENGEKESYIQMSIYVKKINGAAPKSMLMFECRDTGCGVDAEQRQKLYSPFSADTSAVLEGTNRPGLGLYSVAVNISSLGGRYGYRPRDVEGWDPNSQDKPAGSIFWFAVPLSISYTPDEGNSKKRPEPTNGFRSESPTDRRKMISIGQSDQYDAKEVYDVVLKAMEIDLEDRKLEATDNITMGEQLIPVKSPADDSKSSSKRALVIDDSLVIRKLIGSALATLGFFVTYASDGMQGLQALQSSKYDVVFCDFLMPVLDGLDCIEQYRCWESKHRPDFHQKIVGLSGHAGTEDIDRGTRAGMDTFVSKSVKLKDMLEKAMALSDEFMAERKPSSVDESSIGRDVPANQSSPPTGGAVSSTMSSSVLHRPINRLATHPALSSLATQRARDHGPSGKAPNDASRVDSFYTPMHTPTPSIHRCLINQSSVTSSSSAAATTSLAGQHLEETPNLDCLICEDSKAACKLLVRVLRSAGWFPQVAEDSDDALTLLKRKRWGAALVDEASLLLVASFREWEIAHRKVKQNNLFLVTGGGENGVCPPGFNGTLQRPFQEQHIVSLLERAAVRRHDREEIDQ